MRGTQVMCAAVGVLLAASPASADSFENYHGGEVSEQSHVVRIVLDDGFARYRVRRSIRNDGDVADELTLTVNLPPGAAADGLRVRSQGKWHAGDLLKAEQAQARFDELTDLERERPSGEKLASRPPVLLEWEGIGTVTVKSFPVLVGESVTFEYTMVVPTCWGNGRQYLQYPTTNGAKGFVEPLIAVTSGKYGGKVTLHGPTAPAIEGMTCGDGITTTAAAHTTIEIGAPTIEEAATRYGLYATSGSRFVARLDIDAAETLAPLPKKARVVFVLDGSFTIGDERLKDQLGMAQGYLSHVPDAQVEVVVFRRYAERLFGEFESADLFEQLVLSVPARKRALGNGSNLEEGVALAANLLSGTSGPARMVVFTDERTRNAYSNELAIAAAVPLPRHAVVHVVDFGGGYGAMTEYRSDDSLLAPLAAAYGGMLLRISGDTSDPAPVAATMLGLVRPIRIDNFGVDAEGKSELDSEELTILNEGEGRRAMFLLDRKPKQVRVAGMIWGREWSRNLQPHKALSAATPGLVFGDDLSSSLNDAEQLSAAMTAGAVSAMTSYLAAEDLLVPVPDEEELLVGLSGGCIGGSCCGSRCGFSTRCGGGTGYGTYVQPPNFDEMLQGFMKSALENCGRASSVDAITARLTVEATGTEIVDVSLDGDLADELRSCIVDGAWDVRLSSEFDKGHQSYYAALTWARK